MLKVCYTKGSLSAPFPAPLRAILCALLIASTGASFATAGTTLRSFVAEVPESTARAYPVWLEPASTETGGIVSTVHFGISPIDEASELAVTVYFSESDGGFLRAIWSSRQSHMTLSSNLYEGVGGRHQRTILLDGDLLGTAGVLTLQANAAATPVHSVRFEWLESRDLLATEDAVVPVLVGSEGRQLSAEDLHGDARFAPADVWRGDVATAPLIEVTERIESGVEFVAELPEPVSQARLSVEVTGIAPSETLALWINGLYAGPVNLDVADLADPAYYQDAGSTWLYGGWRQGSLHLPASLLKSGENRFQFTWPEREGTMEVAPIAVRNLSLQLRYPEETAESAPSAVPSFRADAELLDLEATSP
jgi:hypothetical protein